MSKPNLLFKDLNKPQTLFFNPENDENQQKNEAKAKKRPKPRVFEMEQSVNPEQDKVVALRALNVPATSYKDNNRKWSLLTDFFKIASRSHHIHKLKFQTLFLSHSLAERTVELVLNNTLEFEYWVACCLFMSMKYEEIYFPRLKDLNMLVKRVIEPEEYNKAELKMMEFIDLNMNFESINSYLSEYLHACSKKVSYFIFYFLEIALTLRSKFSVYSLKEIVLSIMFIFSSHRLHIYQDQNIDGIAFSRIESCSKELIINHISIADKLNFLFKKYRQQRMQRVALCSIPKIEKLTALLMKKIDMRTSVTVIIGLCEEMTDQMMESQYQYDKEDLLKILISRQKYRMSLQQ